MKKFIAVAFGLCLLGGVVKAQTLESKYGLDSLKTIENASLYQEFVKQKNYKDALSGWRYVFNNAPVFQMMTYTRGEDIITNMFLITKDSAYLDTLMMVYDQWIKYFGQHERFGEGYVLGKQGAKLSTLGAKDAETQKKAFGYLVRSYELEGPKTHPLTVQILFFNASELLKQDLVTKDEYIQWYIKLSKYIEHGMQRKPEMFKEVKDKIDAMFFDAGVADCETLNKLLSPKYEAAKEDVANLKEISSLLRRSECIDLPLYMTVAEQSYKLDPTAEAAYSLAIMFLKRQELDKTEAYLKEAISKSEDDEAKADYYLRMAQIKLTQKQLQAVKTYALEVLKLKPNSGTAYKLMAQAYALYSEKYGEDAFDHASVFLVVVDKLQRAKQVEPGMASDIDALIKVYSQYFPDKSEAFFRGVSEGAQVKVGDWINETTTARFKSTK